MPQNIILLTIDALRADHASWNGYNRETTPFLDDFVEDAMIFENSYSASSHTRESVPALLTGHHPTDAITDGFTRGAETIPMYLNGHQSAAFHSNPYVSRAYGFDEGFDHFFDDLKLGQNKLFALAQRAVNKFVFNRGEYHARAEEINDRAITWVDSVDNNQPFFLWNHYMDVHGPYNPPNRYAKWSKSLTSSEAQRLYDCLSDDEPPSKSEASLARDLYDGEIRYVDKYINKFIQKLDKMGVLDESLLIITSDHGELFGEYGKYTHPRLLYPELVRVPMIIREPTLSTENIRSPVSTLDILPSILKYTNNDPDGLPGSSLLNPSKIPSERLVFSMATGEGENENIRRFGVQSIEHGYRFSRDINTGDILDENIINPFDDNNIDDGQKNESTMTSSKGLKKELIEFSNQNLEFKGTNEGRKDKNTKIEERLEALGYK